MLPSLLASPRLLTQLLVTTILLHLLIAVITPLTVDEAHYALYGQFLDWSYFDHPPLVGWLQALALQIGENEWQLRLWALLSYALSLWLIHGYTRYLTHSLTSANLAALLFCAMPILHVLGIGLVPDTLLLPLSIALIWRAQQTLEKPTTRNWLIIGLLLGLSALSKYTAALFAIGLLLVLLTSTHSWRWFIKARFWLAVFVAGLLSLPIFYWNMQHDWISIHYQLNHGRPAQDFEWLNVGQSQLSQLFLYTPLIWFSAWLSLLAFKEWWQPIAYRQLLLFVLPALIIFTISSGKEPSLPHWLAFFYVLLLPLMAHQLINQQSAWIKKLLTANLIYGFTFTLLVLTLSLFPKLTEHWSPNPTQDLIGWKQAAEIGQALRQTDESLIVSHWVDASRIAWYARPTPVVVMDERYDQFDIWFGSPNTDTHGILILPPDRPEQSWHSYFQQCQRLAHSGDGFQFFRCKQAKLS
ncbi:MAG: glycosyltransferase family 39 protein [Gammaproteobacteria bacterium]|nr:glycosyltransferase family 39 protein [Gammaproteobacteria bacterium]